MVRTALLCMAGTTLLSLSVACTGNTPPSTTTPAPSSTSTPLPATKTPFPTFTPTPVLEVGVAIVVGGDLRVRGAPSTKGPVVKTLKDQDHVQIDRRGGRRERPRRRPDVAVDDSRRGRASGTGLRTARSSTPSFVFFLLPNEESPLPIRRGEEKWIDVNVTTQTANAMIGARSIHTAPVSTGSPQFPSPLGSHRIEKDGRLAVERMTATQAGYTPGQATYDVERVLFTQYYDRNGDALHLNYWRPESVFGHTATSHGCVGLLPHDAQYFWLFGAPGMRVEIHT